jgi:hypothetical protein
MSVRPSPPVRPAPWQPTTVNPVVLMRSADKVQTSPCTRLDQSQLSIRIERFSARLHLAVSSGRSRFFVPFPSVRSFFRLVCSASPLPTPFKRPFRPGRSLLVQLTTNAFQFAPISNMKSFRTRSKLQMSCVHNIRARHF